MCLARGAARLPVLVLPCKGARVPVLRAVVLVDLAEARPAEGSPEGAARQVAAAAEHAEGKPVLCST
jgi:hypothetical protein